MDKVLVCPICGKTKLVNLNHGSNKIFCPNCQKEVIPLSTPQEKE